MVAFIALRYFKSQTEAMQASLKVTQDEVTAQQHRWEDQRQREIRSEHAAVRPDLSFTVGGGPQGPNAVPIEIQYRGGKPMRSVGVSASLPGRQVAAECEPNYFAETATNGQLGFMLRAGGMATGDRVLLHLTYVDSLGALVVWRQPLRAHVESGIFGLAKDPNHAASTADDLPDHNEDEPPR